ncbi:LEF-9 [Betabaculovirus altermyunipunctae]|uniref:LEF-9 n=1 Tax=Betabaculovirus altermyunipunctae TaxID=3051996 RepID=A0A1S5YE13_9BBAC|nr:LEF-9 [Betabaculovirus altermyunipunctae]AQQ80390.1 LEF-9 [Betabaculovirus altermyunipunctae]
MSVAVEFENKPPTRIQYLTDYNKIDKCVHMSCERFGKFVRDLLFDLKQSKCGFYNSIVGQLITVYQDNLERNDHTRMFARVIVANNIVVTDIKDNVFLRKLKVNRFTDDITYLILPNFTLWDHNFLVFLNKKFNSKKEGGLVNIWGCMQKITLAQGVLKDLIQNKNGYAGQYLYSTFLNTASFYANVQCFNGINEIVPPRSSIQRYFGRRLTNLKVWNTRHPNISQLSTQVSRVRCDNDDGDDDNYNWNIKVGLGTFVGANRDCDGDKEVITYLPYPNSLIDLESLLYCDPVLSFICFDKNKLSFVSQQIYYLYKNLAKVETLLKRYPLIYRLWLKTQQHSFSARLDSLLRDVALMLSSNCATLLFTELKGLIDNEELVCDAHEIDNYQGCFRNIVESGAKGSKNLVDSTERYRKTDFSDVEAVSERALDGLNSHITSHGRVKFCGGDIYHNTVVFLNLYLHDHNVCYKQNHLAIGEISHIPSSFLFPEHLLDEFLY